VASSGGEEPDGWWDVVPQALGPLGRRELLRLALSAASRREAMIYLPIDWAEDHHDLCLSTRPVSAWLLDSLRSWDV
jgi:hypothetical protein